MEFIYEIDGMNGLADKAQVVDQLAMRLSRKESEGFDVSAFDKSRRLLWGFTAVWDNDHAYTSVYTRVTVNDLAPGTYQKRYSTDTARTTFVDPMGREIELESGMLTPRSEVTHPLHEWLTQSATSESWEPMP